MSQIDSSAGYKEEALEAVESAIATFEKVYSKYLNCLLSWEFLEATHLCESICWSQSSARGGGGLLSETLGRLVVLY